MPEPDADIQIGRNPFLTEPQTATNVHDADAAAKQLSLGSNADVAKGDKSRSKLNRENHCNHSSYIPPETVLGRTGQGSFLQRNVASTASSEASSGPRYPAPSDLSRVQNNQSLGRDPLSQDEYSFVRKDAATAINEIVDDVKKHLERPHSLHLTTNSTPAAGDGPVHPQEQIPVKGILKKSSGSVTFDSKLQISDSGNASEAASIITSPGTFSNSYPPGIATSYYT